MNSKKSGIYFSQAFKSFISFLLIFSMVITPGLLPTVSKAEETEVAENQETKYLTAADLYQRYIDVAGQNTDVLGFNQSYNFDYSNDAPSYGQLSDVKFTQVASGYLGGYALDENGKVWSWGYNIYGRAGIGKTEVQQNYLGGMMQIPYFVKNDITVTKIAAGYYTGYALDSKGQVYAWGLGSSGQMGNGKTDPINISPVKVEIPVKVKDFNVSNGEAIHHAAALDENDDLWL